MITQHITTSKTIKGSEPTTQPKLQKLELLKVNTVGCLQLRTVHSEWIRSPLSAGVDATDLSDAAGEAETKEILTLIIFEER